MEIDIKNKRRELKDFELTDHLMLLIGFDVVIKASKVNWHPVHGQLFYQNEKFEVKTKDLGRDALSFTFPPGIVRSIDLSVCDINVNYITINI